MPGMSGLELLRWLRAHGDVVPAVMMSARGYDDLMRLHATREGVACLRKPFTWDELVDAVRDALDRHEPKVQ
jgi:DNA-binding response OmpR family regulator